MSGELCVQVLDIGLSRPNYFEDESGLNKRMYKMDSYFGVMDNDGLMDFTPDVVPDLKLMDIPFFFRQEIRA